MRDEREQNVVQREAAAVALQRLAHPVRARQIEGPTSPCATCRPPPSADPIWGRYSETVDDLDEVIERYHLAADEFSRGDPEPVKMLFSHRDDVSLANPFGPAVRGWMQVSEALDSASSRFSDGQVEGFDSVAKYMATDLACILELERWRAKVGDRENASQFDLRVTSTFRREDDGWKLVHRHADPITTSNSDGPLR
jgi:ketosteroid isomerase-like protein